MATSSWVPVGGTALPIQRVSPTEIVVHMPYTAGNRVYLRVESYSLGFLFPINLTPSNPSVVTDTKGNAQVTNIDGSANTDSTPAMGGTVVTVRAGSLGNINGSLAAGVLTPTSPALSALATVSVHIGSQPAFAAQSAVLEPGSVGIYRVRFTVPQIPYGKYELELISGNATSNAGYITIQPTKDPGAVSDPCAVAPIRQDPETVVLPRGSTEVETHSEITKTTLSQAFPNEDISTDAWLANHPCDLNVGGYIPKSDAPVVPGIDNPEEVAAVLEALGPVIAGKSQEIDPQLPRVVGQGFVYQPKPDECQHPGLPLRLLCTIG